MRIFLNLQKSKEEGFTLMEMLLATAISLIGLSAGVTLFLLGYKHFYLGQNVARVQQRARIALEKMVKEFQETAISTIDPDPSIIDSGNPATIISFASARDDNNNFLIGDDGMPDWINAIVYFRDANSNTLYRYRESKTDWSINYDVSGFNPSLAVEPIATSVTGLEFWFDNDLLNIKIKIVLNPEAENPSEEEWITAIRLRN